MDIDESSPSRASDEDDEYAGDGDEAEDGDEQRLDDEQQGADSREEERATAGSGSRLVDTQTAIAELAEAQQVLDACILQYVVMYYNLLCTRALEMRGICFLSRALCASSNQFTTPSPPSPSVAIPHDRRLRACSTLRRRSC